MVPFLTFPLTTQQDPDTKSGNKQPDGGKAEPSNSPEQPDARLAAFFSGLLLSKTTADNVDQQAFYHVQIELAQAWSIGLLSASLPWRMICAFTVAGLIRSNPLVLSEIIKVSTLSRFFSRLPSTVVRRVWAERAATPVCSRYVQSLVELLSSVRLAVALSSSLPEEFTRTWRLFDVDAATPLPLPSESQPRDGCWQALEGWETSNNNWVTWTGIVAYQVVDWKQPMKSSVTEQMDGGEGPPFLNVGCTVIRGVDWGKGTDKEINDDGKDIYDAEKAKRDKEKKAVKDAQDVPMTTSGPAEATDPPSPEDPADPTQEDANKNADEGRDRPEVDEDQPEEEPVPTADSKKKKIPSPKLPTGTVLAIEGWNGQEGLARRVRWHLTDKEGVYRFGGEGGKFDLCHVEVNKKQTKLKKRYPVPESAEQCASRHGFGKKKSFAVLLRLPTDSNGRILSNAKGVLEWPDFGAAAQVAVSIADDGTISVKEERLLYGAKDSGWEIRFGHPSFVSGTQYLLSHVQNEAESTVTSAFTSLYEELKGATTFSVEAVRDPANGKKVSVSSEMTLWRGRSGSEMPPPLRFDPDYLASSLSLSRDGRTVACTSEGRGTVFSTIGFTKGLHYWEVKLEQADIGSVFIGVAEKPCGTGSGYSFHSDSSPRLTRWPGWGFVNFRATYASGGERVYGAHCHTGDTVGVLLDCDAGRVSFFFDGLKYGEHILNDLGCAFENLSPFGFNVDGCGSGGAGQNSSNGFDGGRGRYPSQGNVRPRALFPVIGLRNQGDRVTFSSKWNTSYGVDGVTVVKNILRSDEVLSLYASSNPSCSVQLPQWLLGEAFMEYQHWSKASLLRTETRGSGQYRLTSHGLDLLLDTTPEACAAACASLGLDVAFLSGDRVRLLRSAGRILELAEEALILGACEGRLYYRIVSQKSEGGSLTEGGGRAWCLDESEVVDGLPCVSSGRGLKVPLPKLQRFCCPTTGGLKVVHEEGAVHRSDLEISDNSLILGTIPVNTVLSKEQVLERRVNSSGVVRYRVSYGEIGEGWISARIRGGKEEAIVEAVESEDTEEVVSDQVIFQSPADCASVWYEQWRVANDDASSTNSYNVESTEEFKALVDRGVVGGLSTIDSDALLCRTMNAISNFSESGEALDCPFDLVASAMAFAFGSASSCNVASAGCKQAAASVLSQTKPSDLPTLDSALARLALLRSLNRRCRLALPWLSTRPCQEGSAIFGGLSGHGPSVARAARGTHADYWLQLPDCPLRSTRQLLFTSVKQEYLQSVTEVTTTPTPLNQDEYELPREIRMVRINRLKARRAMATDSSSNDEVETTVARKYSVFAQLQSETKHWGGAALRRGYVAKGHGGQKRAFKVKLIGEGVNDYSGPYREVFTDAVQEVTTQSLDGHGILGVLDASPNRAGNLGDARELLMFSLNRRCLVETVVEDPEETKTEVDDAWTELYERFGFLTLPRDESSREVEDALIFLGRLVGTAYRHGMALDLPLPLESVWKALVEEQADPRVQLKELDILAAKQWTTDIKRTPKLLLWQQRMLNSFTEGLSSVIPVELLALFSGEELRETLCGNPEVDVDLLHRVVEYEGYEADSLVVEYFWTTLREMTNSERQLFLQFVWARNRLPVRESDFESPFKIIKDTSESSKKSADLSLPSASTCFFSLTLPEYSSQTILRDKLLFAITNVTTMETDFQTNSAEIAEGYRSVF